MNLQRLWRIIACSFQIALFCQGTGLAAMTLYDVVNYGSRIGTGLPGAGIAQGAIFAVTGDGLGPSQAVQASFPLPSAAGLAGVAITITASDGKTTNALMVYASPSEVDAILPSGTPFGSATVTVTSAGTSASLPITVVQSAFGIFTGTGAFNVASDGPTSVNTPYQSAQPGQTVMISGTGLGAISSDETLSGASDDVPNANITVWVGLTQATLQGFGRGFCCSGINPNFPIPSGVAGWDVIAFNIPQGVQGCQVSVTVQNGSYVSNVLLIAVAQGGGTCPEAAAINGGNPVVVSGRSKTGLIEMLHMVATQSVGTATVVTTSDSATALFPVVDYGPNPVTIPSFSAQLQASVGSCFVTSSRVDRSIAIVAPPTSTPSVPITFLDAGSALNSTAPDVTEAIKNQNNIYNATAVQVAILLRGSPPSGGGDALFLAPGPYMLDNGSGGADIGPFITNLQNPTPVSWDNMGDLVAVDRSQGVTVTWSGGDPNGVISIVGGSGATQGTVSYAGVFGCYAQASAGQFTVPPFITLLLPSTGTAAEGGSGTLSLNAVITGQITIPGVDITSYFAQQGVGTTTTFQ
jgi:uncharacterized protein (TIGR03437 family)